MKAIAKKILVWLGLSVLMMIFWIVGLMIGNAIFPSSLMDASEDSGNYTFFVVCALNTAAILYFMHHSTQRGWKLVGILFFVTFGIQYFMSQIETLWFNDSLKLPLNGVWAIVAGGAIMCLLVALSFPWVTGKFSASHEPASEGFYVQARPMVVQILLFSVIVWPLVYFMAGYLIAWQFADLRLFYSGTTEMDSLFSIMKGNVLSGLYFFQIFRGALWIVIALVVFSASRGNFLQKGVILGILLALLGSSGLLLPNPYMPYVVRMGHLIETSTSSFIWGLLLAWGFVHLISRNNYERNHKLVNENL